MKAKERNRVLRRGLLLAGLILASISLAALALSQSQLGADAVADLLERVRLGPILASLVVMTSAMFLLGARWRSLIPGGENLPILGLSTLTTTGLLLNVALPGPAGELAVAVLVERRYGVPATAALAGALSGRFVGLASAGLLAAMARLSGELPVPAEYSGLVEIASLLIFAASGFLAFVAAKPQILSAIATHSIGRLQGPGRLGQWMCKAHDAAQAMARDLSSVAALPWTSWLKACGWSLAGHLCVIAGIGLGAWGMGVHFNPWGLVFTYSAATAGIVALFLVPGGQLGWDAMFAAFLHVTAGVPQADAVAVAVLVRVQQTALLLIGAASFAAGGLGASGTPTPPTRSESPASGDSAP
ncbi:MAG: uncharacterized membrane protein YbhN (UPF0104 family) [Cognaticolwellia sp.]